MEKKYKAIIFDLDNTLYNFSAVWLIAFSKMHKYLNLDSVTTEDKFLTVFKKYDSEIIDAIHKGKLRIRDLRNLRIIKTMEYFGRSFTEREAQNFYDQMFIYILESLEIDTELLVLLKKLKKHYKLYLLTNGIASEQRAKLKKLHFEEIFDELYISSETNINKPNLRAFLQILAPNKLHFDEVLMIGDSLFHDILGAKKLGIDTIYIKQTWHLTNLTPNIEYNGLSSSNIKIVINDLLKRV